MERALKNEIKLLEQSTKMNYKINDMDFLPSFLKSTQQKQLELRIKDLRELYKVSGEIFRMRADMLRIPYAEVTFRHAMVFRDNYMRVMRKKYKGYKNFEKFEDWARKHKDPVNFFNSLPEGEYFPDDLQYQSDKTMEQEAFNSFLEEFGIKIED